MAFYFGWLFLILSGILVIVLIARSGRHQVADSKRIEIIAGMAGCWVLGCWLLTKQHYEYLYIVNALAAGKFIFTQFTGWKWN